ncbi:hypothetical protein B0H13DRAFT_1924267 [Mycena leptocephala]|nr:hypothetical protein B0H13DRAFT_1924267 [Mycena leptocephala]
MSASILETTLARGGFRFLELFFRTWDPPAIFILGRLNYRLRSIVHFYFSSGHNFEGFSAIGRYLMGQFYEFRPAGGRANFDLAVLFEAAHFPESSLKVTGERSTTQDQHRSRSFKFVKTTYNSGRGVAPHPRVVIVHLVRSLAAFMNFISGTHAVSTFPYSTFLRRLSFVSCQEMVPGLDVPMTELETWLQKYGRTHQPIKLIGLSDTFFSARELGRRTIGDERCWTIPCTGSADPLELRESLSGPAFDVLSWKLGVTRHGSYLRVGEPFVWSSPPRYEKLLMEGPPEMFIVMRVYFMFYTPVMGDTRTVDVSCSSTCVLFRWVNFYIGRCIELLEILTYMTPSYLHIVDRLHLCISAVVSDPHSHSWLLELSAGSRRGCNNTPFLDIGRTLPRRVFCHAAILRPQSRKALIPDNGVHMSAIAKRFSYASTNAEPLYVAPRGTSRSQTSICPMSSRMAAPVFASPSFRGPIIGCSRHGVSTSTLDGIPLPEQMYQEEVRCRLAGNIVMVKHRRRSDHIVRCRTERRTSLKSYWLFCEVEKDIPG